MRWITFLILLFLMFALQIAHLGAWPHGPRGDEFWPAIEFLPLLAVFYALFANDAPAPLAAALCGIAYDIGNHDYLGTHMIPLALVALAVVRIRLSIFREHALTHAIITFLAILAFGILSALDRSLLGAPLHNASLGSHFGFFAGNALYSALFAPPLFWLLFRLQKLLGFSYQGAHRKR
jgi:rod shape-determining protein MreD